MCTRPASLKRSDEHGYGNNQAVWLENGRKVLDYMEADERFSAASFKDSMEEQGIPVDKNDLMTLIDNMRRKTRGIVVLHRCLLNPEVIRRRSGRANPEPL
jgi:hypothetical protein